MTNIRPYPFFPSIDAIHNLCQAKDWQLINYIPEPQEIGQGGAPVAIVCELNTDTCYLLWYYKNHVTVVSRKIGADEAITIPLRLKHIEPDSPPPVKHVEARHDTPHDGEES